MTFAGGELNQGISALGHGFADMGQYISKSISFLTFALIVRSVVDLGFVYIVGLICMATVAALFMWNLHLQMCLARERHSKKVIEVDIQKTKEAEGARTLEVELENSRLSISRLETEKGSLEAEVVQGQSTQKRTERELEEARILLLRMSRELTQTRSQLVGSMSAGDAVESAHMFSHAKRDSELEESHREIRRLKQELVEAKLTISCLEGSPADAVKRRRSV